MLDISQLAIGIESKLVTPHHETYNPKLQIMLLTRRK